MTMRLRVVLLLTHVDVSSSGANRRKAIGSAKLRRRSWTCATDSPMNPCAHVHLDVKPTLNAREEDVMVAAFDHMDRVDLDIAEMLHRRRCCRRAVAEGRIAVKPLRPHPDPLGGRFRQRIRFGVFARHLWGGVKLRTERAEVATTAASGNKRSIR